MTADADVREVWFLTGSQGLYGAETLRQVAAHSQQIAQVLDDAAESTCTWSGSRS